MEASQRHPPEGEQGKNPWGVGGGGESEGGAGGLKRRYERVRQSQEVERREGVREEQKEKEGGEGREERGRLEVSEEKPCDRALWSCLELSPKSHTRRCPCQLHPASPQAPAWGSQEQNCLLHSHLSWTHLDLILCNDHGRP